MKQQKQPEAPSASAALATPSDAALARLAPAVEAARGYAAAARSSATRRAYATSWRSFTAWCEAQGVESLPARPEIVAVYLATMADLGRKPATIDRALAGIAAAHREAGAAWTKGHAAIGAVRAGIRRTLGTAPRKKSPVEEVELRAIIATLDASLAGLRDRALLLVGWFAALRRSELVALDVESVRFTTDGLVVRVARGKTDQVGAGLEKGVPYAGDPALCAVRALRAWLEASAAAGATGGAVFRSVDKCGRLRGSRLSDRSVARVVQRAARAAGLDATAYAGHSLRAGFATTAARKGRSLDAIMRQTGHKSERVARGYVRHATLFTDNAAAGLF
jgi:integrase